MSTGYAFQEVICIKNLGHLLSLRGACFVWNWLYPMLRMNNSLECANLYSVGKTHITAYLFFPLEREWKVLMGLHQQGPSWGGLHVLEGQVHRQLLEGVGRLHGGPLACAALPLPWHLPPSLPPERPPSTSPRPPCCPSQLPAQAQQIERHVPNTLPVKNALGGKHKHAIGLATWEMLCKWGVTNAFWTGYALRRA